MALDKASLQSIPTSFASCSIGYDDSHTLPLKLDAISQAGFQAIELSFPDILAFGKLHTGKEVKEDDYDTLSDVAREIARLCAERKLKIMMLQPFANFEGWPLGSAEREDAFKRAKGWARIMEAAGTDILQIGSTDASGIDTSRVVPDLQELADYLAPRGLRIAYENWCWSTHAATWRAVWDIVRAVDRENVGLCLDTFQTAGSEWADPTASDGRLASFSADAWRKSLDDLAKKVPKEKIYLLQISDAYKPSKPLEDKTIDGMPPRGRWSHDYRPVPPEGYLPVAEVAAAVLRTGFRGWFSMEVFDSGLSGEGKKYELEDFANNAMKSHKWLIEQCADA
ncbi:xylose isomerase-like protein [Peniophora sp. CONT]|nr:xylose isomerase-like protein [Peniophora sp. CONT]